MDFAIWCALLSHHRTIWVTPLESLYSAARHLHTNSNHPIANGLVECFHRQLKSALKASPHPDNWTDMLPLVLLDIYTTLKEDIHCTAAELVYGRVR